ncbi:acyl-CoA dehydrogenase family protein [Streptomyces sp. Wb2n-11]|uniref:acyl-CoA dehydrogenase family protein n=1 Tax=Streptomyces sp. Wb2n-11 TaxID=1030533 RepID=UPI000AD19453|nr:acyl-CoA dehydrogenase family protein [Streptomyces sp. Wb2n-11]
MTVPSLRADSMAAFHASARTLVRHHLAPHLMDWETNGGATRRLFDVAGRAGVFGVPVPVRDGGLGLGLAHGIAFIRAVSRYAAGGVCTSLCVQTHVTVPLLLGHGSEEQKQTWLQPVLRGRVITAVAITEPTGGSDLVNSTATRAVPTGRGWLLDGEKTFITNAPLADCLFVLARTDAGAGALGMTFFLVPADLPGVQVQQLGTVGLRSSRTGRIRFTGCELPAEAVLGRPGLAMAYLAQVLGEERLAISAGVLECARCCVERTAALSAVATSQRARAELAGWLVEVEAAEAFLDAAVERFDDGAGDRLDADLAKTMSARLAQRVVNGCARLIGPDAFSAAGAGSSLLPALRDVRVLSVFGGSCETVRDSAAAEILRGAAARRRTAPLVPAGSRHA